MEELGASDGASSSERYVSSAAVPGSRNNNWAEISPLLAAACDDLHHGDLIHGQDFSLYAAMSALEIMDPKMDSGIVRRYCTVDEAIEGGAAPIPLSHDKTVDTQRVIDVMDHLLACEATWHCGHSLAQTVFSCMYLLKPERTSSHALLHSYCKILRATCKAVISVVSDTRTHEEEDLFTLAYGLPLTEDGDERCFSLLNAIECILNRQLRGCKAYSSKENDSEDFKTLFASPMLEEGYCKAILCRIRFRKHFFHALLAMKRPQGKSLELARKHINSCFGELKGILSSEDFLVSNCCRNSVDEMDDKTTASGNKPIGFDANINSNFSAPTPPRSISLLSWRKAIKYFEKLLDDLDIICSQSLDPSMDTLLKFVSNFQKSRPDLVSRAHLQSLLIQDGKLYGRYSFLSVIMKGAGLPETTKNEELMKNEFISQIEQLTVGMLKILCTNTAWQRRKLGKIIRDFRLLFVQMELALNDECGEQSTAKMHQQNVDTNAVEHILVWLEELTYWISHRFLFLGFELELYAPADYCMVYWYMFFVLNLLSNSRLKMTLGGDRTCAATSSVKHKGKKKKSSLREQAKENRYSPHVSLIQCQACIAEGLTLMLAASTNELNLFRSRNPFNTESERFFQNFEPLLKAGVPENISYSSYKESTSCARFSTIVNYNCFNEALKIAREIKGSFSSDPERLAEVVRLEQVAEHNNIALNVMCRESSSSAFNISFQFLHHPFFAVAVLKRS